MLHAVSKVRAAVLKVLEIGVVGVMALLVLDVLWQVIARKVLNNPSTWTDEVATMLLIWVALLGASVAFARKSHLGVDYFVGLIQPRSRAIVEGAVCVLIAAFAVTILIYGGYNVVSKTLLTHQRSPALDLKVGYVYMALPISGALILIVSLEMFLEKILPPHPSTNQP